MVLGATAHSRGCLSVRPAAVRMGSMLPFSGCCDCSFPPPGAQGFLESSPHPHRSPPSRAHVSSLEQDWTPPVMTECPSFPEQLHLDGKAELSTMCLHPVASLLPTWGMSSEVGLSLLQAIFNIICIICKSSFHCEHISRFAECVGEIGFNLQEVVLELLSFSHPCEPWPPWPKCC